MTHKVRSILSQRKHLLECDKRDKELKERLKLNPFIIHVFKEKEDKEDYMKR